MTRIAILVFLFLFTTGLGSCSLKFGALRDGEGQTPQQADLAKDEREADSLRH